jgi:hypothetical protein
VRTEVRRRSGDADDDVAAIAVRREPALQDERALETGLVDAPEHPAHAADSLARKRRRVADLDRLQVPAPEQLPRAYERAPGPERRAQ